MSFFQLCGALVPLLGCFVYDRLCLLKVCFTADLMQDNSPYLAGVRKWPLERLPTHDVFAMINKKKHSHFSCSLSQVSRVTLCRSLAAFHFHICIIHSLCKGITLIHYSVKVAVTNGTFPISTARNEVETLSSSFNI